MDGSPRHRGLQMDSTAREIPTVLRYLTTSVSLGITEMLPSPGALTCTDLVLTFGQC